MVANAQKPPVVRSAEEYPAKLLQRIATAIHSQRHRTQCYADAYTHCNTRSRWQNMLFFTQNGVQG